MTLYLGTGVPSGLRLKRTERIRTSRSGTSIGDEPGALSDTLAEISSLLLSEDSTQAMLARIVRAAVRTIPNCDLGGMSLKKDGEIVTRAATEPAVQEVDDRQYESGGPCVESMKVGIPVQIHDMSHESRWTEFSSAALANGIHSVLSLPLVSREASLGALNLYSKVADGFTEGDLQVGTVFATQASVTLANSQAYEASVELSLQLREALDSRAVIDQAKGILMEREHCEAQRAFDILRKVSQQTNRKLRDVALEVVDSVLPKLPNHT